VRAEGDGGFEGGGWLAGEVCGKKGVERSWFSKVLAIDVFVFARAGLVLQDIQAAHGSIHSRRVFCNHMMCPSQHLDAREEKRR
jgi:hypothetical protein